MRFLFPLLFLPALALGQNFIEPPMLRLDVSTGRLPPTENGCPSRRSSCAWTSRASTVAPCNSLVGRSRDTRLLVVYGYARLVGYDRNLELAPTSWNRSKSRKAHLHPAVAQGSSLVGCIRLPLKTSAITGRTSRITRSSSPAGPPRDLLVDGEPPKFEMLSDTVLRYTWHKPNLHFLPRQAGASPLFIYRPAHYLKALHKKYSEKVRKAEADGTAKRRWSAVHNRADNLTNRTTRICRRCSRG